jgi:hypothetical protein
LAGRTTNGLPDALSWIPADATGIKFTDWTLIKQDFGLASVTSTSSLDDRTKVLQEIVSRGYGLASDFAVGTKLVAHGREWGWDSFDLEWEAKLPPDVDVDTFVLRTHDQFDLRIVLRKLLEHGFQRRDIGGAVILAHAADQTLSTSEPAIANVALVPTEHVILASTSETMLQRSLATHDSGASLSLGLDRGVLGLVLEDVRSVSILAGIDTCELFRPENAAASAPKLIAPMQRQLAAVAPLGRYEVLAAGFKPVLDRPHVDFVMRYPTAAAAARDAAGRGTLARDGISVRTGIRYDESVMQSSDLLFPIETDLLLGATPVGGQAFTIFNAMRTNDMLWAACTE